VLRFLFLSLSLDCEQFWDRVSLCSPAGLKFRIVLPQPPECWEYRHAHVFLIYLCSYSTRLHSST
jgi:hypothetical protein